MTQWVESIEVITLDYHHRSKYLLIDLRLLAEKMIGRKADHFFNATSTSSWTAPIAREICDKLIYLATDHPTFDVRVFDTYACPDKVTSGQTYALYITERIGMIRSKEESDKVRKDLANLMKKGSRIREDIRKCDEALASWEGSCGNHIWTTRVYVKADDNFHRRCTKCGKETRLDA